MLAIGGAKKAKKLPGTERNTRLVSVGIPADFLSESRPEGCLVGNLTRLRPDGQPRGNPGTKIYGDIWCKNLQPDGGLFSRHKNVGHSGWHTT